VLALLALTAILLPAAYLILQQPPFGGRFEGTRLQRMRQSPEYKDGRFENTPPQKKDLALIRTLQNYAGGQQREPGFEIPVMKLDRAMLEKPAEPGLRAYWFGHASVLVEIDGARIMTDPILSDYASPFQFIGPRRLHPPPLPLKDLSGIDAVVISHDHFDHLDMGTVVQLARGGSHFYVGLAVGAHLERWGVPSSQIHEMDWWEQAERSGVVVHATPARHYSGRKSMDNSTLWASWWVKGPHHSFYFSGDTGYGPHFREIADRLGPADLALIKIGAYGETWLDIHMDPEAAIQAALDVHATTMLPVHWATFNLSYHAWVEPIVRARGAASTRGVDLVTPRVGERFEFGQPFRSVAWYDGPG
jgi:L-ascorbate metabolism protein UlaG (beta-lactamase superfamily)